MDTSSPLHQSDDRLELYALRRLSGSEVEQIEEHLLLCGSCVARLEEIGVFAIAAREDLKARSPKPGGLKWFGWPRLAVAGAFAMVLLALFVHWTGGGGRIAPVASLQLTALRGEMQQVQAAHETDLSLTDAPASGAPFRVEVVDANGASVWSGAGLQARIRQPLSPGDYFVRLFGSTGQLLHEYGFHVRAVNGGTGFSL